MCRDGTSQRIRWKSEVSETDRKRVYLDYAATTPLDADVLEAMRPYLSDVFGNANSLYREGREAHAALEEARGSLARVLGAKRSNEVIFTSGGTESDNAALLGMAVAGAEGNSRNRVIVSSFEHHAVLECAPTLARLGYRVDRIAPRADGFIHPDDLTAVLDEDVVLVSIMHANNEIGTVQPVAELARRSHEVGALFHTDAVQAFGKVGLDLEESGVDAASFSAHKVYGPKGTGALYLRRRTPFRTQMRGGGQEATRRSGTQNVAGAVGFAKAAEIAAAGREVEMARERTLRDRLVFLLPEVSDRIHLTVDPMDGVEPSQSDLYLPNLVSFCIEGLESETTLLFCDEAGFAVSGGSACASRSLEPSHVLLAIGMDRDLAFGSLRVSLGRATTMEDIDAFAETLSSLLSRPVLS